MLDGGLDGAWRGRSCARFCSPSVNCIETKRWLREPLRAAKPGAPERGPGSTRGSPHPGAVLSTPAGFLVPSQQRACRSDRQTARGTSLSVVELCATRQRHPSSLSNGTIFTRKQPPYLLYLTRDGFFSMYPPWTPALSLKLTISEEQGTCICYSTVVGVDESEAQGSGDRYISFQTHTHGLILTHLHRPFPSQKKIRSPYQVSSHGNHLLSPLNHIGVSER